MKTWLHTAGSWAMGSMLCLGMASSACAQQSGVHMLQHGIYTPPGAIGSRQAMRGGPVRCFFQPVEIKAPPGAKVSLVEKGRFDEPVPAPRKAGLVLGQVYRLRITNIPYEEGREVFPTIELIDRLHPPRGQEVRFAIPIEFSQEDLELALEGKYVTRVIYLEDPNNALPVSADKVGNESFDARASEDPLEVADRIGRPMAIVRMGGRLPEDATGKDRSFFGNCPPLWNIPSDPNEVPVQASDMSQAELDADTDEDGDEAPFLEPSIERHQPLAREDVEAPQKPASARQTKKSKTLVR